MHLPRPDVTRRAFAPLGAERLAELSGLPLATFRRRLAAFALDWVFLFLLWLLAVLGVGAVLIKSGLLHLEHNTVISSNKGIGKWTFLPASLLYFALTTWHWDGQTPGKRLLGIRVLSLHGTRLHLWTSLERFLGYGASMLEFGFGFLQFFLHPNRQTVHDRIAETIVVRVAPAKPARTDEPFPPL